MLKIQNSHISRFEVTAKTRVGNHATGTTKHARKVLTSHSCSPPPNYPIYLVSTPKSDKLQFFSWEAKTLSPLISPYISRFWWNLSQMTRMYAADNISKGQLCHFSPSRKTKVQFSFSRSNAVIYDPIFTKQRALDASGQGLPLCLWPLSNLTLRSRAGASNTLFHTQIQNSSLKETSDKKVR